MTLSLQTISTLEENKKANIRLVLLDIQFSSYTGGQRTRIIAKDCENETIQMVGFNDVHPTCKKLELGRTYVFNDVMCSTFQEQLQLKILSYSAVNTSSEKITMSTLKIKDLETKEINDFINLTAVVSKSNDTLESANGRSMTRRMTFVDDTGFVNACIINSATEKSFEEGDILNMRARIGNNQQLLVFTNMSKDDDTFLKTWWADNLMDELPSKRLKQTLTPLNQINDDKIGNRIDVCVVILESSIGTTTTSTGMTKKTLKVGDSTLKSIELSVFGEGADYVFEIGQELTFTATISEWNLLSLTTNSDSFRYEKMPVCTYASMSEWWNNVGCESDFECLSSIKPIDFITIDEILSKIENGSRVSFHGIMHGNKIKDATNEIEICRHHSVRSRPENLLQIFDGKAVIVTNGKFKNGKIEIFKTSLRENKKLPNPTAEFDDDKAQEILV